MRNTLLIISIGLLVGAIYLAYRNYNLYKDIFLVAENKSDTILAGDAMNRMAEAFKSENSKTINLTL